MPKRFLLDTSLLVSTLGLNRQGVLADGFILGRLLETFVAMQLRPDLAVCDRAPRLYHLREKGQHREVDFVLEYADGAVAAVEVKATSSPSTNDARHLAWFRDSLGDQFIGGVVLHTGPHTVPLGDRVWAAPISTLWA